MIDPSLSAPTPTSTGCPRSRFSSPSLRAAGAAGRLPRPGPSRAAAAFFMHHGPPACSSTRRSRTEVSPSPLALGTSITRCTVV